MVDILDTELGINNETLAIYYNLNDKVTHYVAEIISLRIENFELVLVIKVNGKHFDMSRYSSRNELEREFCSMHGL